MRGIAIVLALATATAHADRVGHSAEWTLGGGADDTASVRGDPHIDGALVTGFVFAAQWRVLTAGVAGSLEISEGLGLRLGGVFGPRLELTERTRLALLVESGVHSVSAQSDASASMPYVGARLGIARLNQPGGGRSHGLYLAWQQDLVQVSATHRYQVCPLFGSCRYDMSDYELGGWAVMLLYRLGYASD